MRRLPGRVHQCNRCQGRFVWARTASTERGPGGRPIPLNPDEDPRGSYGVRNVGSQQRAALVARPLAADDTLDTVTEIRAMPHAATCQPALITTEQAAPLPANVIPFQRGPRRP